MISVTRVVTVVSIMVLVKVMIASEGDENIDLLVIFNSQQCAECGGG